VELACYRYRVPMSAPQLPPVAAGLRWGRALMVAALTWGATSAAHVSAGGDLPSWPVAAGLVVLTAWPLSLALRQRAGALRMIALMAAGQAIMHTALVMLSWYTVGRATLPSTASHPVPTGMPGMDMSSADADALAGLSGNHAMSLLPSFPMVLAHVVAAMVLGAVLADGERALFVLLGLVAHLCSPSRRAGRGVLGVLALLAADTSRKPDPVQRPRMDVPQRHLRERVLVTTLGRRGPPLPAFA